MGNSEKAISHEPSSAATHVPSKQMGSDRMGPLDASFWHLEDAHASLHIAGIAVFEGPVPAQAEIVEHFRRRLHLVPRYRQKMRTVPFNLDRPVWVDDPAFELSYHVRRTAVAAPGGDTQLQALLGRLMSQRLDRERPLWEAWIVEGLEDGRWALVSKLHHSMVDGIAGMDVLSRFMDVTPEAPQPDLVEWTPRPEPSSAALVTAALRDRARTAVRGVRGLGGAARHPRQTITLTVTSARGLLRLATAAKPFTSTSLAGPIGASRRYRWLSVDGMDIMNVRKAFGGSPNDVVLAIVTRGIRDLLVSRGEEPEPHAVRCLVPVSVRRPNETGQTDNRVSALLAELPVDLADPVSRLEVIAARTKALKLSHEADAGELVTELSDYLPPPAVAAGLHTAFRLPVRTLTTVVTNVPGPRQPLYALGRRMLANYPYVPIADRIRLGVAVSAYDGQLCFGVTGDRATMPDIDVVITGISDGLIELVKAAEAIEEDGTK